jgi:hypothetical protein
MADKMLRGRAPLTFVRGTSGVGQHVYFSGLVDPGAVDPGDLDRLVAENYLEWVVRDGGNWKLAEDAVSGDKGDPVTVGSTAIADPGAPETDPGLTNSDTSKATADAQSGADAAKVKAEQEIADRRAGAKAKLPSDGSAPDGRASKDVLVEYLAGKGYAYDELVKQDPAELRQLTKQS